MSSPLDSEEAGRSEATTESALFFILNTQTRYFLRSVGLSLSLCNYLISGRSHSRWIHAITPCHQCTCPGHSSGHILKHIAKHFSQLPGACRMKALILNLVSRPLVSFLLITNFTSFTHTCSSDTLNSSLISVRLQTATLTCML